MINEKRVRRIKNIIYVFIVLLFLVPAILLIVLGVRMLNYMPKLDNIIRQTSMMQAQAPPPDYSSAAEQPDMSSSRPESQYPVPQNAGGQASGSSQGQVPVATDPEPVSPDADPQADEQSPGAGGEASAPPQSSVGSNTAPPPPKESLPSYGDADSPNTGIRRWGQK